MIIDQCNEHPLCLQSYLMGRGVAVELILCNHLCVTGNSEVEQKDPVKTLLGIASNTYAH